MGVYADQLAEVRESIAAVLTGQRLRRGDREVQLPTLAELQKREQWLIGMVEQETAAANGKGRSRVTYVVPNA